MHAGNYASDTKPQTKTIGSIGGMASLTSTPAAVSGRTDTGSRRRPILSPANWLTRGDILTLSLIWAIRVCVGLLFVTPLIVTTSTIFPFIVGKALWSRSLIEISVGLYLLLAIHAPEVRPTRSRVVLLLGIHLLAVFVAGGLGSSFNLSFWSSYERMSGIFDQAHWFLLAAVLVFTVKRLDEWKAIAAVSLVFGLGAAFLGLAEKYDYDVVGYLQDGDRVSGATGNPSFLAGHMMLNGLLALTLFVDRVRGIRSEVAWRSMGLAGFYLFTFVVSAWVLSETGTKGSALGLLVGLLVAAGLYSVFSGRRRVRIVALVVTAAVPLAVIVLFLARDTVAVQEIASRNNIVDRVVSASLEDGSLRLRTVGLRISGQAFMADPVTGWGGENFEVPFQRYQREGEIPANTSHLDRAHNKPLNLLATTGLLGFLTYLALWACIGVLSWRRVKSDPANRVLHAGVAGTLVALLIHEMFLFDTAVTMLLFVVMIAWAAGGENREPLRMVWSGGSLALPARFLPTLRIAAPVVIAVVLTVVISGVNWRTYRAAQLITVTEPDVQKVVANLDHFGPLGTFGRERLLTVMANRWSVMDEAEQIEAIGYLERTVEQALRAEPDNMEIHFAAARFYRAATSNFPELIERARFHTDIGAELGRHTASTAEALDLQQRAEDVMTEETS